MAGRGSRISSVGIEFGSSSIKLVKLIEERGVIRLDNYGEISLGPFVHKANGEVANLDTSTLQTALSQLLVNMEVDRPDAIAVAIPLSATLVMPLEFEVGPKENLEVLVIQKIKEQVPVPLDQVFVDWQEVHHDFNNESAESLESSTSHTVKNKENDMKSVHREVICYVINKDIIQNYVNVLAGLNQEIDYFELEIYSVIRSALTPGIEKAIVADIGAKYSKLYAIKHGEVHKVIKKLHGGVDYTNSIVRNLKADGQRAEDIKRSININEIPNQLIQTEIHDHIKTLGSAIKVLISDADLDPDTPVYLCGGGVLLQGLPERLADQLDTKVIICQPFTNVQSPAYLDKILLETGPEYAVSAGLAMKHLRVV